LYPRRAARASHGPNPRWDALGACWPRLRSGL